MISKRITCAVVCQTILPKTCIVGCSRRSISISYVAGTALGLGALASPQGQALLDAAEERGRMDRIRFEQGLTDLGVGARDALSALADLDAPIGILFLQ